MATVLLTHAYFLPLDPKQWKLQQPYAPLATLYAAAVLREAKHEVSFFDTMFAHQGKDVFPSIDTQLPKYFVVYADGFNYLTKMCLSNMQQACFEMLHYAKSKGCITIVSSSDSTDHTERYLEQGADYVLIGEAEHTLLELINTLEQNSETQSIAGLVYQKEQKIVRTLARSVEKELDVFPSPAWDLVDIAPYKTMWMERYGYFSINVATTRGCPFKCNWCAKPIYGNRYNSHSPARIVAEITQHVQQFGASHIWFCDDIFGLKPNWVQEFNALVQKNKVSFKYKIQSRADLVLETDTLAALAASGCEEVWIGAESGSQKILDAMDKGTTVEQIKQATLGMKAIGIKPCFFLQFGYLGETYEDIEATLKMVFELMPYNIGVSVSYPLPGTKFYETVKQDLSQKTNWTDSDELLLMFKNTFPPNFYKNLHKYLHKRFRAKQAQQKITKSPLKNGAKWAYYIPQMIFYKAKMQQTKGSV